MDCCGSKTESAKYHCPNLYRDRNIIKSAKHIIRSMKQKYGSYPYMDDSTVKILPICKCLQSIMTVTNIGTEK